MAFSKQHQYDLPDQSASAFARALSHPARLKILRTLKENGRCAVIELARDHPIHKESLSDHLRILRGAALVNWEEKYPHTYYTLNHANVQKADKILNRFLESFRAMP